jgi:DNA-directed RNA polymerase subunit RPC12/RpoP
MHQHPQPGAKPEIAQVFRRFAQAYRRQHALSDQQARVLSDLEHCRTSALGEHLYRCQDCGREVPLYNSCLNRHCPTCQGPAQYRWIEQRQRRLLNTAYFHAVFTVPAVLREVICGHRQLLLDLLFQSVAQTLHAFAAEPQHLGAQLGFTLVLHTWSRTLFFHPHIHAIVTGGGLSSDGNQWIGVPYDDFLFPVTAVSEVFRGKFLHGFIDLCKAGKINLTEHQSRKLVRESKKHGWVVYAKKPFGGPRQIVNYLGRYTHRVAISSARLISINDDKIVFRTRAENTCALAPQEFVRRFLLHVLPPQFFKIRHYGLLAPGNVNTRLMQAQLLLGPVADTDQPSDPADNDASTATEPRPTPSTPDNEPTPIDRSAPRCPHCGGRLVSRTPRRFHRSQRAPPNR